METAEQLQQTWTHRNQQDTANIEELVRQNISQTEAVNQQLTLTLTYFAQLEKTMHAVSVSSDYYVQDKHGYAPHTYKL